MALYLDFYNLNNTVIDIPARANIAVDTARSGIDYKFISLAKIDIDCSNLYLLKVPLQQPQQYNLSGTYKQDEGYYETIFSFKYIDYDNKDNNIIPIPIYFKSNEQTHHIISYTEDITTHKRTYDNHDKYFEVYNLNNLLSSINENIRNYLVNTIHWSETDAKKYAPCFYTDGDTICYNCLSNDQDNDANHVMVDAIGDLDDHLINEGTYAYQRKFTIGFSKNLSKLLLRPIMKKNINDYDFVNFETTGISSYFEVEDTDNIKYKILSFYVNNAFDYVNDIRQLLITSNLSVQPLYNNVKQRSFKLDDNNFTCSLSDNVIYKMQINSNSFNINRLIYSQPSITNNYSILNRLSNTNFNITVQFVDKYNNIIDYSLPPGDQMFIQLCAWSDDPVNGFFGRKRGADQVL